MPIAENPGSATAPISKTERERAIGHKPGILWFTGLPAAGKSTVAAGLGRALFEKGYQVIVLDGDSLRAGLNANLGFSHADRSENVRRTGEVAGLFVEAGFLVIVALISPYRADRARLRAAYPGEYHEIYVSTPLEICEARDPKGDYKRARDGELHEFTGVSAPYETPVTPELVIDTTHAAVEQTLTQLAAYVEDKFPLRRLKTSSLQMTSAEGGPEPGFSLDDSSNRLQETNLIQVASELESCGRHQEALEVLDRGQPLSPSASYWFSKSRALFNLAVAGGEKHAYPALLAALEGIECRCAANPDALHAIGIIRWVQEYFADAYRLYPHVRPAGTGPASLVQRLSSMEDPVAASWAILDHMRLTARYGREKESLRRETRFYLATLAADAGNSRATAFLTEDSYPLCAGHDCQLYPNYLQTSSIVRHRQRRAIVQGIPSFLIASLPKSASEFLCYAIAEALDIPAVRISLGRPFNMAVYDQWVSQALQGGCITHEHFAASPENVSALRRGGAKRIVALVRDPRAAAWSWMRMHDAWHPQEVDWLRLREQFPDIRPRAEYSLKERQFPYLVAQHARWVQSWIELSAGSAAEPKISILRFKDLVESPEKTMAQIFGLFGAERFLPKVEGVLERRKKSGRLSSNFRSGNDAEWQGFFPAGLRADSWDAIPDDVKQLFDLGP